ncbi:tRNA (N(6)-L-threonylcarbamoyladenosine(37)-C(2))-methylthiotransferase MtaB [bacterium]|nr:tRNA (N(6)-L-threonylcarbamoyladenosine(37)-C(2))-methylthiotransferase MtaB [bacterium]
MTTQNNNLDFTFAIQTLGCKVNTYESQVIVSDLLALGFMEVSFNSIADIYIINTCSVTNQADLKSRNMINRALKLNKDAIIVVTGCYTTLGKKYLEVNKKINIIVSNDQKLQVADFIIQYLKDKKNININHNMLLNSKEFEHHHDLINSDQTRAFVKIQDGCNMMCSYCIIPFARGKQRAKQHDVVIREIVNLVKNGFLEIVLTGVNTAGYLDGEVDFYKLLKLINEIDLKFKIRISSVEPFQISDEIIDLITNNQDRFCQHWHLCLQSGSNKVLKDMNRNYTSNEFIALINKIKAKSPLSAFTTDVIVAYPTENENDFNKTIEVCKEVGFFKLHVFPYSKRSMTKASFLDDLHGDIKKQRVNTLIKLSDELGYKYLNNFLNKEIEVLFEHSNEKDVQIGHSDYYFKCLVKTNLDLFRQKRKVKVKGILNNECICELVD